MPHSITLITTIAASLGLALIMGIIASRLKLPPLVGYLIAGVLLGPATPGFVADAELSSQLAEIGVILLMFGVGLHFSLDDLLVVHRIALPGAIVQIAVATALGMGVATLWGGAWAQALCSVWPFPWQARSYSSEHWSSAACSSPSTAGSRWAG